jgi:zinc/manganese transport system substrate-binding protein
MNIRKILSVTTVALSLVTTAALAQEKRITIVAAENFYGNIASQIGGDRVAVTSILSNPDQDPHLFETSPSGARQIADADIVIYNGADYDPWMEKLLKASPKKNRRTIVVAEVVHRKAGDNPHLWYDPRTMPAAAAELAKNMEIVDPVHASDYRSGLAAVQSALNEVSKKVGELGRKYAGVPITATEPVFGYMANAIGLKMRNESFQLSVMNDSEPSISDAAAFENDLRQRKVKVLIYSKQATGNVVARMLQIAASADVPVVGVTETEPADMRFQDWMLGQLDAFDKALSRTR